jgi:hypothetical protein
MSEKDKLLKPGKYIVTATIQQTVTVEKGVPMTEMDAVDEALEHSGSKLVDWNVEAVKP